MEHKGFNESDSLCETSSLPQSTENGHIQEGKPIHFEKQDTSDCENFVNQSFIQNLQDQEMLEVPNSGDQLRTKNVDSGENGSPQDVVSVSHISPHHVIPVHQASPHHVIPVHQASPHHVIPVHQASPHHVIPVYQASPHYMISMDQPATYRVISVGQASPHHVASVCHASPHYVASVTQTSCHRVISVGNASPRHVAYMGNASPHGVASVGQSSPHRVISVGNASPHHAISLDELSPHPVIFLGEISPRHVVSSDQASPHQVISLDQPSASHVTPVHQASLHHVISLDQSSPHNVISIGQANPNIKNCDAENGQEQSLATAGTNDDDTRQLDDELTAIDARTKSLCRRIISLLKLKVANPNAVEVFKSQIEIIKGLLTILATRKYIFMMKKDQLQDPNVSFSDYIQEKLSECNNLTIQEVETNLEDIKSVMVELAAAAGMCSRFMDLMLHFIAAKNTAWTDWRQQLRAITEIRTSLSVSDSWSYDLRRVTCASLRNRVDFLYSQTDALSELHADTVRKISKTQNDQYFEELKEKLKDMA